MAEDTARTNHVSPQGSILWAEDDALARAMEKAEYSGRVRETGLGPLPVRPTSRPSTSSASRLSQEAAFDNQMNEMVTKWEEERRRTDERREEKRRRTDERREEEGRRMDERIAAQSQMIANMQKMIENLAAANAALVGNSSATQDTESPNVVRVSSSVASRPG
jgi:hypothetical protein